MPSKHPETIKISIDSIDWSNGYTEVDVNYLAEKISDLRYDKLKEFLNELSDKIAYDAEEDLEKGRAQLAEELELVIIELKNASFYAGQAWEICKPYEEGKK